jgi:hypothetical protein
VREIGRSYRASSGERDPATLRHSIDASPGVQDDFANGRTVIVNGWVLARTEARQCALFDALHA